MKSKLLTIALAVIFAVIFLAVGEVDFQEAKTSEAYAAGYRTETAIVINSENGIAILETASRNGQN